MTDKLRENDPHNTIFTYLSENEFLPSTRAAEEDSLHAWSGKFIRAEDLDRDVDLARKADGEIDFSPCHDNYKEALKAALEWADKNSENSKYHRILNCRFTRLYFFTLSRMPAIYRDSSELKFSTVIARNDHDMGVSRADCNCF